MKPLTHYYVGIDIGSETFACSILTSPDSDLYSKDEFLNTPFGFEELEEWLAPHKVSPKNSIICLEATGVYGESLCYWLYSKGYSVALEPPQKVKRAFKIKGHKNDQTDSKQIAQYAYRFLDELNLWKPRKEIIEQIAVLLATREQFVGQRTACTNAAKALKRKVVQTPLANKLYEKNIEHLNQAIENIEKEIGNLIAKEPEYRQMVAWLSSIPSVALLLASNMLVMTDGFIKSKNIEYRPLAAHIGICPYQHKSGISIRGKTTASGHGPARARKLLYLAARTLRTHHPQFKEYFLRKRAEGKDSRLVLNNISNKLLKIMCAVIRNKKPYIKNYMSINPQFIQKKSLIKS